MRRCMVVEEPALFPSRDIAASTDITKAQVGRVPAQSCAPRSWVATTDEPCRARPHATEAATQRHSVQRFLPVSSDSEVTSILGDGPRRRNAAQQLALRL